MQKHFDPLHLPFWIVPLDIVIIVACDEQVALYCMWQDVMEDLDAFHAYPTRVPGIFSLLLRDVEGGIYSLLLVLDGRVVCTNSIIVEHTSRTRLSVVIVSAQADSVAAEGALTFETCVPFPARRKPGQRSPFAPS